MYAKLIMPIAVLFILFFLFSVYSTEMFYENNASSYASRSSNPKFFDNNLADDLWKCTLPTYDSWDTQIQKYYDPRRSFICNKNFTMLTKLEDNRLYKTDEKLYCWGRCLLRGSEYKNTYGYWIRLDTRRGMMFKCDIIETICSESEDKKEAIYDMVHYQVVPVEKLPAKVKVEKDVKQYNVHVILIDSLASSQADRQLANTMRYIEKSMGAITFPYLNKVGANSRPNGIAVWFGKQMERIDRTMFGLPSVEADKEMCTRHVDNVPSLFSDFREYGYRTLLAEGSVHGCVNYPNCKGFEKQPTDHYMRPMHIETTIGNRLLTSTFNDKNCFPDHRYLLEYQKNFMDAYTEELLFSWLWIVGLGHQNANNIIRGDIDLLEWFMKVREKIDNSFVIIFGDHGFRLGGEILQTKLGALDVNNPMLSIILPKVLRKNTELVNTMKENSKKLITHYDTRATILDILKYQPLTNFTSHVKLQMEGEKGNSLFRKMDGERSCRTLPIPLQYCLCEYRKEYIHIKGSLARKLGSKVIELANLKLAQYNVLDKCALWKFDKVTSLRGYRPHLVTGAYAISVTTTKEHDAVFNTQIIRGKDGNYRMTVIERGDRYKDRGDCVDDHLSPICDCIRNHTTTKTPTKTSKSSG